MTDVYQRIQQACCALRMRGVVPVRLWLTRDDLERLVSGTVPPLARVRMRYGGLPVNVAVAGCVSRVVSAEGVCELI